MKAGGRAMKNYHWAPIAAHSRAINPLLFLAGITFLLVSCSRGTSLQPPIPSFSAQVQSAGQNQAHTVIRPVSPGVHQINSYDAQGRLVKTETVHASAIPVRTLTGQLLQMDGCSSGPTYINPGNYYNIWEGETEQTNSMRRAHIPRRTTGRNPLGGIYHIGRPSHGSRHHLHPLAASKSSRT